MKGRNKVSGNTNDMASQRKMRRFWSGYSISRGEAHGHNHAPVTNLMPARGLVGRSANSSRHAELLLRQRNVDFNAGGHWI